MVPKRTEDTQGSLLFMMMGHRPHTRVSGIDRPYGQRLGVGSRGQRALPLVSRTHTASQHLSTYETAWKPEDSEVKQQG